jgi:hypothetical protein
MRAFSKETFIVGAMGRPQPHAKLLLGCRSDQHFIAMTDIAMTDQFRSSLAHLLRRLARDLPGLVLMIEDRRLSVTVSVSARSK